MEAVTQQQAIKKCPACAELILADALKCKHCGERLDGTKQEKKPRIPPEKRKSLAKVGVAIASVVVVVGAIWAGIRYVPESALWVGLHSDVQWHRDWQDARLDKAKRNILDAADIRARVAAIYKDLSDSKPDDGNWKYLAIRALDDNERQLDAYREAAKKFATNPWITLGLAAAEDEHGDGAGAATDVLKAIDLFGTNVPDFIFGRAAVFTNHAGDSAFKDFYWKSRDRIVGSAEASVGMAQVSYDRGDLDGMVKWEEHAEKLGHHGRVGRDLKQAVTEMRIRTDFSGMIASAYPVALIRVLSMSAEKETKGNELVLRVKYTNLLSEEHHLWLGDMSIIPTSGSKITSSSNRSLDVPAHRSIEIGVPFSIPSGTKVEKLVYDTGRKFISTGREIVAVMNLEAADASPVTDVIWPDTQRPTATPALASPSTPASGPAGKIIEKLDAPPYTYLKLQTKEGESWAAVPKTELAVGSDVVVIDAMPMKDHDSKTLNRKFALLYFGKLADGKSQ